MKVYTIAKEALRHMLYMVEDIRVIEWSKGILKIKWKKKKRRTKGRIF